MPTPEQGTRVAFLKWRCLHCGKEVLTEVKTVTFGNYQWSGPPPGWLFGRPRALAEGLGQDVVVCSTDCAEGLP